MARTNDFRVLVVMAAAALAAALLMLVAARKPAKAAFPGKNGSIAFVSDRDSTLQINDEIYKMNLDGSKPTCLTNNPAADEFPAVSPDGTKIAFVSNRDDAANPNPGGDFEIYVMNAADGSDQTNITNKPNAGDIAPDWGPAPQPKK